MTGFLAAGWIPRAWRLWPRREPCGDRQSRPVRPPHQRRGRRQAARRLPDRTVTWQI